MKKNFLLSYSWSVENKIDNKEKWNVCLSEINLNILNHSVSNGIDIYFDGYILPRNGESFSDGIHNIINTIFQYYIQYGDQFIKKFKGIFIIIIKKRGKWTKIFSDQLGIYKLYYHKTVNGVIFSNSLELFKKAGIPLEHDEISLVQKSLLHRTSSEYSLFRGIKYASPASHFTISPEGYTHKQYWDYNKLFIPEMHCKSIDYEEFAELFKKSFINHQKYLKPKSNAITLTGGKDSRSGLATLLHIGIKPIGFTYGNPQSRDAVFAQMLAKATGINHYFVNPVQTSAWFEESSLKIIKTGNSEINIHRSHRMHTFRMIEKLLGTNTAYYGGYLGGEFLMGLFYDNLQFTKFLTGFWENPNFSAIAYRLENYFHKLHNINLTEIIGRLKLLKCFKPDLSYAEKQFHAFFEIAIPHHSQDLQLAHHFLDYPIPFFLDIDFIELLFKSRFSFRFRDNKSKNLLKRYELFEFNLNIQDLLFPGMNKIPFAKRGTYTTSEFLKGKYYWSLLKVFRNFTESRKYPVTFAYEASYKEFLRKWLKVLLIDQTNALHDVYDVSKSLIQLDKSGTLSREGQLHKHSNIVMHYMQQQFL